MTSPDVQPHVAATAGHVDHGKSALILRLTGMDPDRLSEEKRRGLTIDLGFAWTRCPRATRSASSTCRARALHSKHAGGVGPVRLVLFVVAADEGWKPQSEEHLQILDVLGTEGAVVALTKRDLVDAQTLDARTEDVRRRLDGTRLAGAPVIACSSQTGEGVEDLRAALDAMVSAAPARPPASARDSSSTASSRSGAAAPW
jgi:selenocysteine-specific elongation factor